MKAKTYLIKQAWKNKFIIDYQVTERISKGIQFTYLEHYLQFVDLLKEAGYKEGVNS